MKFVKYERPEEVGWLGYIIAENGSCLGFVALDGEIKWGHGLTK